MSFLLLLPVLFPSDLLAQRLKPGLQDMTFLSSVDESNQPYAIYIPENFDESKKYPLVIFLHGSLSNHRLGIKRVFGVGNIQGPEFGTPGFVPPENDLESTRYYPEVKNVDYIAAAPFARGTAHYQNIPEQDVFDMLEDIKSRFNIDEDRMYLTGLSMGARGTLWIGLTRPDLWAAIAPVAAGAEEGTENLAGNALNLHVHLLIGDRDGRKSQVDEWYEKFIANDVDVEYIVYPGIGHNSWEYAYNDGFIFEWFSQFKRDPFPVHVKFTSKQFKYDKAYWVKFDNLTPGTEASIDAQFTGENMLEITTSNLLAFTLNLEGHPQFDPLSRITVNLDGQTFVARSPDAISFSKENGSWVNRKFTPGLFSKQPGAEGPLYEALGSNHVYVYGTQGDPSPEVLQARRDVADYAADWAFYRPAPAGRIMIFPRAVADNGIRQSDIETSNLVLFGTAATNSLIQRYADRLPVQLNEDASDYGLAYIYPMNGHYVLINSGLPWWTPSASGEAEQEGPMGMTPGREIILKGLGDFILFKGNPDNVIWQGNFDNNWQLPQDAVAKLKSSGVVRFK